MTWTPFSAPHSRSPTFTAFSSEAARAARVSNALVAIIALVGWFKTAASTAATAPPSMAALALSGRIPTRVVSAQHPSCCTSQCLSCIFIASTTAARPPAAATFSPHVSASAAPDSALVFCISSRSALHPATWICVSPASSRIGPTISEIASGPFCGAACSATSISSTVSLFSPEVERGRPRGSPMEVSRASSTGGGSDISRPKDPSARGTSSSVGRVSERAADDADCSFSNSCTDATIASPSPSGLRKVSRSIWLPSPGPSTTQMALTTSRMRSCHSLSWAVP
mmetsp:Transcript_34450/g.82197  ORF Transcript_34450/g.82197 Transcript_34450/m.82197 type:complete len:284 (-) Transcript_34450:334-1185(-)